MSWRLSFLGLILGCSAILNSLFSSNIQQPTIYRIEPLTSLAALSIWLSKIEGAPSLSKEESIYWIETSCDFDPKNLFYRINGAGIMSYDLAADEDRQTQEKLAHHGIALLTSGLSDSKSDAFLHYEIGKIQLLRLKQPEVAQQSFERAAKMEE